MDKKICPIEFVDKTKKQVMIFCDEHVEQSTRLTSVNTDILKPYELIEVMGFVDNHEHTDIHNKTVQSTYSANLYNQCSYSNSNRINYIPIEQNKPYFFSNGSYYFIKGMKRFIKMTNFYIANVEQCVIHHVNGMEDSTFNVRLMDTNMQEYHINIATENYRDLFKIIGKTYPQLDINTGAVPKAIERFSDLASSILRNIIQNYRLSVVHVYNFWGWGVKNYLYENRKFYHGGLQECYSHKVLLPHSCNSSHRETLRIAFDIVKVGEFPVISTLFTYAAAAYMDALFCDSGYPLAHSIMLIGATGVMKTSLVKVLFSPFEEVNQKIYTVRGTEASFNVLHEKCFDDVLVVDDFNREGSKSAFQHKLDVVEGLIRSYSDKTPKAKYGGNDTVKQYAIRGGLVITSETQMSNAIESLEFRYIKLHLKNKLNADSLATYQQNPNIIKYFFSEFIRFLEQKYIAIVRYIKANFQVLRRNYSMIGKERLIDDCVHLMLTQIIIQEFLKENQVLTVEESQNFLNVFERTLIEILKNQNDEVKHQKPALRYLREVWHLLESGQIHLANNAEEYFNNKAYYIGYIKIDDFEVFMLDRNALYRKVAESLILNTNKNILKSNSYK